MLIVLLLCRAARDLLPRRLRSGCFSPVSGLLQLVPSRAGRPGRWRFRILGPLEVSDEGGQVSLGGGKPRALLAVLLLHPNEVVSADRLIDELWGEDSPERAAAALRVNVSRLRKALPQDVLATRSPGYVIRVEPESSISTDSSGWWTRGGACSPAACRPTRRSGYARRCRCGGARRSRTSPTRASPRRRSPGSRRSGWQQSSSGSTPTSHSGATTSWSESSRHSSPSTRSANV